MSSVENDISCMSWWMVLNCSDGPKYDSGSMILITDFAVFDVGGYTSVLLDSKDDWMEWSVKIYTKVSLGRDG